MSEIETTAADQPTDSGYHDFLGTNPADDQGESEPSTGPEVETEGESAELTEAADGEQQSVEDSDNWLPSEQEKEFPPEVLAKYAKRYGYTPDEIATDPRVARIVKDKINSDILIAQRQQAEAAQSHEEPTPEEQPEAPSQPEVAQQYQQVLEQVVSTFDQKTVEKIGSGLWGAMGGTPEQMQELGIDPGKIGGELARGAADLLLTILPQVLPQYLRPAVEQTFPDFGAMHETAMYARQWDAVRSTADKDGNRPYSKLPAYGTEEFASAMHKAAEQVPGFDTMVFTNPKTGKPLPFHEQARQKYTLLARIAAGQNVNALPAVKQAVATGMKLAKDADRSRQNAKILGAGQSTKQFSPAQGGDPLDDAIAKLNAQTSPFAQRKR